MRGPNPVPGPSFGSTDVDKMYELLGSDAEPSTNVKHRLAVALLAVAAFADLRADPAAWRVTATVCC